MERGKQREVIQCTHLRSSLRMSKSDNVMPRQLNHHTHLVIQYYEVTRSTNFGDVLKVTKNDPSAFNGNSGGTPNSTTQKNIENSWAIQTAVKIIGECKEETYDQYLEGVAILARILLLERDNLN